MRPSIVVLVLALLGASLAPAQLVIGDLGISGFPSAGNSGFTVLHANGTSSVYTGIPFGSTPFATLYDPTQPNSFIVGGAGYLGRLTITGPASHTWSIITNAIGTVTELDFDGAQLLVGDSASDQIVRVDPSTGVVTPITSGAQPWGTELSSACLDPNTGDLFVGGNNAIWRIPFGSSTPVSYASGWTAGSSVASGLAIDPVSLQLVATLLTVNRFVRISPAGVLTNIAPSGPSGCNGVDIDENGDFVIVAAFGNTYRVPNAGGAAVLIGIAGGMTGAGTAVSTVIEQFRVVAGAPGAGGVTLSLPGVPPGSIEGFTVASFDVSLPVGTGPIFGFNPDALTISLINAAPVASPGNPVHWSWPVSFPFYPAAPFATGPGILPPSTVLDFIAVAINSGGFLKPTPVVRLTVN